MTDIYTSLKAVITFILSYLTFILWLLLRSSGYYFAPLVTTSLLWLLLRSSGYYFHPLVTTSIHWLLLPSSGYYFHPLVTTSIHWYYDTHATIHLTQHSERDLASKVIRVNWIWYLWKPELIKEYGSMPFPKHCSPKTYCQNVPWCHLRKITQI